MNFLSDLWSWHKKLILLIVLLVVVAVGGTVLLFKAASPTALPPSISAAPASPQSECDQLVANSKNAVDSPARAVFLRDNLVYEKCLADGSSANLQKLTSLFPSTTKSSAATCEEVKVLLNASWTEEPFNTEVWETYGRSGACSDEELGAFIQTLLPYTPAPIKSVIMPSNPSAVVILE